MASQWQSEGSRRGAGSAAVPRPESLLLAFFGSHLLGRDTALAVSSVIGMLSRLGAGEHATRSALKRMTQRGLVRTVHIGRQAYVSLTPHSEAVLREGGARLDARIVTPEWDGRWTLLAFSVPESHRADRHTLRTQLGWAGFGLLRSGLWIAPSAVEVVGTLDSLGLLDYVKIFRAQTLVPANPRALAAEAWNLPALASGYRCFMERWEDGTRPASDDLSRHILLEAEWLLLIRQDPCLPAVLLPDHWPGIRAEELFRSLRRDLAEPAHLLAQTTLAWRHGA